MKIVQIPEVAKLYSIEDERELSQFVAKNPDIVTLLLEVHQQIRKYFPHEHLALKVSSDYEYPDWEKLVLSVHTDVNYSDEASIKLSEFDENWWLEASSGIGLKLYIGLEFE
jgi:hypothetical protein